MARVVGIDLPKDKHVVIGLGYLYGIGPVSSRKILQEAQVAPNIRVKDLTDDQVSRIAAIIQRSHKVEGDLRREISQNIKRLMDIGAYRGLRHKKGLPVRGQRTHTNARTRKGPRRLITAAMIRKPVAAPAKPAPAAK